jgi:radical SAM superfamily enzyme with C-terminal helix-hairpin-helix motif
VPGTTVRVEAFEEESPMQFDVNTVQPAIIRMISGITAEEVSNWTSRRPFAGVEDFRRRAGLRDATLAALRF